MQGDALTHKTPSMYTIAAGPGCHILVEEPWVKLNHSFDPNCTVGVTVLRHPQLEAKDPSMIAGYLEVATCRDVAEGENLEFDYCTTEYEMSSPFVDAETGRWVSWGGGGPWGGPWGGKIGREKRKTRFSLLIPPKRQARRRLQAPLRRRAGGLHASHHHGRLARASPQDA